MIQFIKECYLASFAIVFRVSRQPNIDIRTGGAIAPIVLVESVNLQNMQSCIEMYLNKKGLFGASTLIMLITFSVLLLGNYYYLVFRGHGIKFAHGFNNLKKSHIIVLKVSCTFVLLATIVFSIWTTIAYRHFIIVH